MGFFFFVSLFFFLLLFFCLSGVPSKAIEESRGSVHAGAGFVSPRYEEFLLKCSCPEAGLE